VLVIDIPSNGHLFPKLAVVAELTRRGHHVTYVTVADFADKVRAAGADVLTYTSTDPLASLQGDASLTPTQAFLRENAALLDAVLAHYGDERPDLVAYDEAAFQAGRVLRATWGRPAVLLAPSYLSNDHYSYFERFFALTPGFTLDDPLDEIRAFLAPHGLADRAEEFRWTRRRVDEPTVAFFIRSLQPAHETFDPGRYVFTGPSLGDRGFLGDWQPPADGLPVVLVSLGTVNNRHLDFFRTAVESFRDRPLHAVVSLGDAIDPADLGPLPPNVEVHRWVHHLKVLEHAVAFVTHGGTGSLSEALLSGTPIVFVPQGPDVLPYAERVAELGFGTVLPPGEADVARLREAIDAAVHDPDIRRSVRALQEESQAAGGPRQAADVLEAVAAGREAGQVPA
jgi:dTDP-L-oleandrosyltransferase